MCQIRTSVGKKVTSISREIKINIFSEFELRPSVKLTQMVTFDFRELFDSTLMKVASGYKVLANIMV
jgi:hypothetical protein